MTLELFSTSAPSGLEPGSTGFCTVAMTRGMPRALAEQLESLSAYRPVFMPGDPREAENPVAWSHLRVSAGGRTYAVVSRTCFAGLDHTGRTNRFAHHVALEASEPRPAGGPAWLLMQPGFAEQAWDGEVRWINGGRPLLQGDAAPAGCPSWAYVAGDPGWAGVALEKLVEGQTVYLVYDPEVDVLPLIAEAIAVLPAPQRWNVTFTTYFTGLPQGVGCLLRGVVRGSPEAQAAPRGSTLDLAALRNHSLPPSNWVEIARGNRRLAAPAPSPMPASVPGGFHRPLTITPADEGEGELYVEDGPVWRGSAPQLHPVPPPGPALVPVPPPAEEEEEEPEEEPQAQARRGVGMGVAVGAALGLLMLGVVGIGAAVLFPDQIRAVFSGERPNGKDKDKHASTDKEKVKDGRDRGKEDKGKDNGGKAGLSDVGRLTLALGAEKVHEGQPVVITVKPEKLQPADAEKFPWDKVEVRLKGEKTTYLAHPVKERPGQYRPASLAVGTYAVSAELGEDGAFRAGAAEVQTLQVVEAPKAVQFELKLKPAHVLPGRRFFIRLEGKLPDKMPWENFAFKLDGKEHDARHVEGKGPLFEAQAPGVVKKYTVTAEFKGAKGFQPAPAKSADLHVIRWKPFWVVKGPDKELGKQGKATIVAEFKPDEHGLKPKGKLQLWREGEKKPIEAKDLDDKGNAKFDLKERFEPGEEYAYKLVYVPADDSHDPNTVKAEVVKIEKPPATPAPKDHDYRAIKVTSQIKGDVLRLVDREKDKEKRSIQGLRELPKLPADGHFFLEFKRGDRPGAKQIHQASTRQLPSSMASPPSKPVPVRGDDEVVEMHDRVEITLNWHGPANLPQQKPRMLTFGIGKDKEGKRWYLYHLLAEEWDLSRIPLLEKEDKAKLLKGYRDAFDDLHGCKVEVYQARVAENKQTKAKFLEKVPEREPAVTLRIDRGLMEQ